MMADKSLKLIESLKVGEQVLSYNQMNGEFESSEILELASPYHSHFVELYFSDGSKVTATEDHPFMITRGKWKSFNPQKTMTDYKFEEVGQLDVGDVILGLENKEIIGLRRTYEPQRTYTIVRLSKNNNFIANGVVTGSEELRSSFSFDHSQKLKK